MNGSDLRTQIIEGPAEHRFALAHSAFVPCHNLWGHNSYFFHEDFAFDVEQLAAASTSGSPAVTSGPHFAAFLEPAPGQIELLDGELIMTAPKGQAILAIEGGTEPEQWAAYRATLEHRHAASAAPMSRQAFWSWPEYVTWVEQKAEVQGTAEHPMNALDDARVRRFVERIEALGLPRGKLTIDAGWQRGVRSFFDCTDGYWRVDREKFPDLPGLCRWLADRGYAPGLWFGLPRVAPGAAILRDRPDLFIEQAVGSEEELVRHQYSHYHRPSAELTSFYRDVFEPFVEMGFRKFKLDYYYGPRRLVRELLRCAAEAITALDPTIEVECHHPDWFIARHCHTVRINDVNIIPGWDWQGLTLAHLRVCELGAPDRIINLDHAGGNDPGVSERDFIRHLRLFDAYDDIDGHLVVSLLPDRFGPAAAEALRAYLDQHTATPAPEMNR